MSKLAISYTVSTVCLHFHYSPILYNFLIDKLSGESNIERCVSPEGDSMNEIRAGTRYSPQIIKVHIAVLEWIAVFFYSTQILLSPAYTPKSNHILKTSASALWQGRFFFVIKSLFLASCRSRAPPSSLEFLTFKNLKTGGNQNEN